MIIWYKDCSGVDPHGDDPWAILVRIRAAMVAGALAGRVGAARVGPEGADSTAAPSGELSVGSKMPVAPWPRESAQVGPTRPQPRLRPGTGRPQFRINISRIPALIA